jgi:hypothetical protein
MRHAAPGRRARRSGPVRASSAPLGRFGPVGYWIVLAGTLAALLIMRQGVHLLRSGTLVLAGFMLVAGGARLVLPERQAGMLSSRRRWMDVTIFTTLGVGLLVAGIVVPTPG